MVRVPISAVFGTCTDFGGFWYVYRFWRFWVRAPIFGNLSVWKPFDWLPDCLAPWLLGLLTFSRTGITSADVTGLGVTSGNVTQNWYVYRFRRF